LPANDRSLSSIFLVLSWSKIAAAAIEQKVLASGNLSFIAHVHVSVGRGRIRAAVILAVVVIAVGSVVQRAAVTWICCR
jgi:hypothetical protein